MKICAFANSRYTQRATLEGWRLRRKCRHYDPAGGELMAIWRIKPRQSRSGQQVNDARGV